jgi:hypothetical protein
MSKFNSAIEVLKRAQNETITEISRCGDGGGVGRVANYAPTLINLTKAIEILDAMAVPPNMVTPADTAVIDRMAAVRAAKNK